MPTRSPSPFENVATVTASNSVSNSVSATPGGVGVTQAMNSAALSGETSAKTATAYSIGQQLIISAWDVIFAIVLVSWVFGWSGGMNLVESSYSDAKQRSREIRKRRRTLPQSPRPPTPSSFQPRWWASSWRSVRVTWARRRSGSWPKSRTRVSRKITIRSWK